MQIIPATTQHITAMHQIRVAVTQNVLTNPNAITPSDYATYINTKGKGWVCTINQQIVGFAIVDCTENNVWALFVHPNFEGQGVGRLLHNTMVNWYFTQTNKTLWLGTEFNTRAEKFYAKAGWVAVGLHGTDETKFEMTFDNWQQVKI
jgi:GNAT superfamily N-acetyltransferase